MRDGTDKIHWNKLTIVRSATLTSADASGLLNDRDVPNLFTKKSIGFFVRNFPHSSCLAGGIPMAVAILVVVIIRGERSVSHVGRNGGSGLDFGSL